MKMYDNHGNVVAEQNVSTMREGTTVITNTMYDNGRPVAQTISVADQKGNVRSETVWNGKLLP
jgi:ectoine hydroxylase-related dioxygenase (phytanoyl-CoA dioxygenase family)